MERKMEEGGGWLHHSASVSSAHVFIWYEYEWVCAIVLTSSPVCLPVPCHSLTSLTVSAHQTMSIFETNQLQHSTYACECLSIYQQFIWISTIIQLFSFTFDESSGRFAVTVTAIDAFRCRAYWELCEHIAPGTCHMDMAMTESKSVFNHFRIITYFSCS